jgi:hypothetical protein
MRELVAHVARIQLASITAASRFITGWAQSADRYAQAISDEVLERMHGETPPGQLIGRLATISSAHLCEITALPTVAVNHFNNELTKPTEPRKRTRQATRRQAAT